mmetsp:Transcript_58449/g.187711  ORF Transcript_58449/g.187711 Transcript_58449/m.187711 type:complete len:370 (+) Transcript_58449:460-1569(+)
MWLGAVPLQLAVRHRRMGQGALPCPLHHSLRLRPARRTGTGRHCQAAVLRRPHHAVRQLLRQWWGGTQRPRSTWQPAWQALRAPLLQLWWGASCRPCLAASQRRPWSAPSACDPQARHGRGPSRAPQPPGQRLPSALRKRPRPAATVYTAARRGRRARAHAGRSKAVLPAAPWPAATRTTPCTLWKPSTRDCRPSWLPPQLCCTARSRPSSSGARGPQRTLLPARHPGLRTCRCFRQRTRGVRTSVSWTSAAPRPSLLWPLLRRRHRHRGSSRQAPPSRTPWSARRSRPSRCHHASASWRHRPCLGPRSARAPLRLCLGPRPPPTRRRLLWTSTASRPWRTSRNQLQSRPSAIGPRDMRRQTVSARSTC